MAIARISCSFAARKIFLASALTLFCRTGSSERFRFFDQLERRDAGAIPLFERAPRRAVEVIFVADRQFFSVRS
jgi:hypothetical protein